jgi:hypothetical protein
MPTGALIVNPSKQKMSASALLAAIAKKNGKSRSRVAGARRARRNGTSMKRNNIYAMTNGKGAKKNGKRRSYKRNGHGTRKNSRRGKVYAARKNSYRRNGMLLTNPGNLLEKVSKPIQGVLNKIPLVGKAASTVLGLAVGAAGAGVGVLALHYAMQVVSPYVPQEIRPVGYTLASSTLAAILGKFAPAFPMKGLIVAGLPAAGVAIDVYRYLHGAEDNLNGAMAGADLGAEAWGDVDDLGGMGAAHEYADASLMDTMYSGDDLTDAEIEAAEFGRAHYWRIFRPRYAPGAAAAPIAANTSHHAGQPGRRWGWLIYMIGMDNFQQLAKRPAGDRRNFIARMRVQSRQLADKLLGAGQETTMEAAAGLLITG